MAVETGTQQESVAGRVWTVRLDPHGRLSDGVVRLSCSRPSCADQRIPGGAAAGRRAAIEHVNLHLAGIRAGGGPRSGVWCACRAVDCAWHAPAAPAGRREGARPAAGAVRCGGPVVLTAYADRSGRLWRIAETCARCAAATPGCRVLDTAAPGGAGGTSGTAGGTRTAPGRQAGSRENTGTPAAAPRAVTSMTPTFSDQAPPPPRPSSSPPPSPPAAPLPPPPPVPSPASAVSPPPSPSPSPAPAPEPARAPEPVTPLSRPRVYTPRPGPLRTKPWGRIAQREVPYGLGPETLRTELVELGDAFRAYQRSAEPDLVVLAELHDRKARAFRLWADASDDDSLRHDAARAEEAARTTREMQANRTGQLLGDGSVVKRMLTRGQGVLARVVVEHVAAHAPCPEPEARLVTLMLTLRAAQAGTGNVTGQDLTGWLQDDAVRVLRQLVDAGWLHLPCTPDEALASRPENATPLTVPELLPDRPRAFRLGKVNRSRLSGWAQKVVGDRKLRKKKLGPATRLLALYTAAHARPNGHLGPQDGAGLPLDRAALFCGLPPGRIAQHAELLVTADWLAEAATADGRLHGRLADRVLSLGGRL
ncbi:hypothetical protein [Streptomyces filamentosus]|uniref:hypothetical protein n=1 Tax=Streptomyces filamentosus TaxID=67294 RepID=UPI00332C918D